MKTYKPALYMYNIGKIMIAAGLGLFAVRALEMLLEYT